jgi:hypothetical protein
LCAGDPDERLDLAWQLFDPTNRGFVEYVVVVVVVVVVVMCCCCNVYCLMM